MKRSPNQEKALQWYMESKELRPQLSAHPTYYFTDTKGKQIKVNLAHIMADWERMREAQKRA